MPLGYLCTSAGSVAWPSNYQEENFMVFIFIFCEIGGFSLYTDANIFILEEGCFNVLVLHDYG